ncbi:MAG: YbjQ family protein [Bacilli bacterium]|nr:YbjQ family protein [Bacilli bacterium]
MKIVTTDNIKGYEIVETIGMVKGQIVQSKNFGKDFLAGVKNIVGGEVKNYTEMLSEAREIATNRMIEEAKSLGADAVVSVRFGTSAIMQGTAEIIVYGTAVKCRELN